MGLFQQSQQDPQDGGNVRLTIDHQIQMIVESELDAAVVHYKPKMAVVIMMRPQTGEILALANRPGFNLNRPDEVIGDFSSKHPVVVATTKREKEKQEKNEDQGPRINRAVQSMVEPGSTFKIVTVAAALAEGCVKPDTTVYCENGAYTYFGTTLHDHRHYGDLTVEDILAKSSNVGAAKLGIQLGDQRLYKYIRKFGFGERTGVLMPGEIAGMVHPWNDWKKTSITHVPMGHEVGVTPLQITMAMCVMANGGNLLVPQIVHDVYAADGTPLREFEPVEMRRVIPAQVAAQVRAALMKVVVKGGTAPAAQVPGFKVAGKTGTAQKVSPNGGYEHGKYVVSFVGFMPAEDPKFVCMVMFDDAQTEPGGNYGGQVAAPIFAKIAEQTAHYMNLTPTEPITAALARDSDARD